MVKVPQRFLSLFIALLMVTSLCPIQAFADDHEFTVQPSATIEINTDTLDYTVSWATSFKPLKVEIRRYSTGNTIRYTSAPTAMTNTQTMRPKRSDMNTPLRSPSRRLAPRTV